MFSDMKQIDPEVSELWDQGQPTVQPFQRRMRDLRRAKEGRARLPLLVAYGFFLCVNFAIGHFWWSERAMDGIFISLGVTFVAGLLRLAIWGRRQRIMALPRWLDSTIDFSEGLLIPIAIMGVVLAVGLLAGHWSPIHYGLVLVALALVTVIGQFAFLSFLEGRVQEGVQTVDQGIKIINQEERAT